MQLNSLSLTEATLWQNVFQLLAESETLSSSCMLQYKTQRMINKKVRMTINFEKYA